MFSIARKMLARITPRLGNDVDGVENGFAELSSVGERRSVRGDGVPEIGEGGGLYQGRVVNLILIAILTDDTTYTDLILRRLEFTCVYSNIGPPLPVLTPVSKIMF